MFELSRYPETRTEHAMSDALNLTHDDHLGRVMTAMHLEAAARRIDLTRAEILHMFECGFIAWLEPK
jgi:hypothetical protein